MIPLRVLHAVSSPDCDEAQALRPVIDLLATQGHESAWLCPGSHPERATDGRTIICYTTGRWRWWRSEQAAVTRRVAAWTPDLLQVDGLSQLSPAIDIGRRLGLSLVTTQHHTDEPYAARRLRDPLVAWVLVPSEHHRAEAVGRLGVARDRIAILPTGVVVVPTNEPVDDPGHWTVGVIADRDVAALKRWLIALAEVQNAGLPVRCAVLARTPELQAKVEDFARGASAAITSRSGSSVVEFIASLDVVCLPSTREAPAMYALTAMANGKPLLAMTTAGLPELVRDGQTAILVEPINRDGLADGLRQLHERSLRLSMGRAARSMAAERYAAPLVAEATLAVYRAALGDLTAGAKAEVTTAWRRMTESRIR